jgi:Endonuclease-reverse transcriptase
VIRTTLVSSEKRWTIIGCYIPPSEVDHSTLDHIQSAIHHDDNNKSILLGDLNANLKKLVNANDRQEETAALLSSIGLQDLQNHFRMKGSERWTWMQIRENI